MKFRRLMSGLVFAIGCMLLFISLLAYALAYLPSPQLNLIRESFYTQSEHPMVQIMNRFMQLVMIQHRQTAAAGILVTAAGILLMSHFSSNRKPSDLPFPQEDPLPLAASLQQSQPATAPAKYNPFAVDGYNQRIQLQKEESKPAFPLKPEPILERNSIKAAKSQAPIAADENSAPYLSYRFPVESKAVEAEAELPSQSGSWLLTRHVPDVDFLPVLPEEPSEIDPEPVLPLDITMESVSASELPDTEMATEINSEEPVAGQPVPSPRLRIRSTMGRHGNRKNNFS